MSYDVILSSQTLQLYSHGILKRTSPFGCCLFGSLPVTQLIWHSLNATCTCDQSSSERPTWQSDCECQSSLQTGLSSRRQEAGSSRGAALSHLPAALAASLPHHSNHVWWCAQLQAGRLFWFQPVWHICCVSCCVVPVCELSATGARVLRISFVHVYRACTYKQAGHGTHGVEGQEASRAPVQLLSRAINPHCLLGCVGSRLWVLYLKDALSANKPGMKS